MIKLNSKSQLAKDLVNELDRRLSKIPTRTYKGYPVAEDDLELGRYIDTIKSICVFDNDGDPIKPFGLETATRLVMDEIQAKQEFEDESNN